MNTSKELKDYAQASATRIPQYQRDVMSNFQRQLEDADLLKKVIGEGDKFPNFKLKDYYGAWVDSVDLLKKGKLIVTFFRGGWCPYCNIELRGYQNILKEIHAKNANVVAISPEVPTLTNELVTKNNLYFPVLTDTENKFASSLGLVFTVSPELVDVYKSFGIDLEESQENADHQLPIPATYIIDTDSTIIHCEAFIDYRERMEPTKVLNYL